MNTGAPFDGKVDCGAYANLDGLAAATFFMRLRRDTGAPGLCIFMGERGAAGTFPNWVFFTDNATGRMRFSAFSAALDGIVSLSPVGSHVLGALETWAFAYDLAAGTWFKSGAPVVTTNTPSGAGWPAFVACPANLIHGAETAVAVGAPPNFAGCMFDMAIYTGVRLTDPVIADASAIIAAGGDIATSLAGPPTNYWRHAGGSLLDTGTGPLAHGTAIGNVVGSCPGAGLVAVPVDSDFTLEVRRA